MISLKIEAPEKDILDNVRDLMGDEIYTKLMNSSGQNTKKDTLITNIFSMFKKDQIGKTQATQQTQNTVNTLHTELQTDHDETESSEKKSTKKKGKKKKKKVAAVADKSAGAVVKNETIKEEEEYDPWKINEEDDVFANVYLGR